MPYAVPPAQRGQMLALMRAASNPTLPPAVQRRATDQALRQLAEAKDAGTSPLDHADVGPTEAPRIGPDLEGTHQPGGGLAQGQSAATAGAGPGLAQDQASDGPSFPQPGWLGAKMGLPKLSQTLSDTFFAKEGETPQFPQVGWLGAKVDKLPGIGGAIDAISNRWSNGPPIKPATNGMLPHSQRDDGWRDTGLGLQPPLPDVPAEPRKELHAEEMPQGTAPAQMPDSPDLEGRRRWPPLAEVSDETGRDAPDAPVPVARPSQAPRAQAASPASIPVPQAKPDLADPVPAAPSAGPPQQLIPAQPEPAAGIAQEGAPQAPQFDPSAAAQAPKGEEGMSPMQQALLTTGLGLLASRQPFLQGLGQAGLQGAQAYQRAVGEKNRLAREQRDESRANQNENRRDYEANLSGYRAGQDVRQGDARLAQGERELGIRQQTADADIRQGDQRLAQQARGLDADIRQGDARLAQGARGLELEGGRLAENRADRASREAIARDELGYRDRALAAQDKARGSATSADFDHYFTELKSANPGASPDQLKEATLKLLERLYGTKPQSGGLGLDMLMQQQPPIDPNAIPPGWQGR